MAIVSLIGCGGVRRRLTIRTNPPGAMVYIDKQKIGVSPISTAYTYYGTREIEVTADGYNTQRVLRNMRPTWYELPGLDFFAENLWPFELRDSRVIDITMVPATQATPEELLANGEAFRIQSSQAVATGPPTAVVPGGLGNPSVPQFEPLPPPYQQNIQVPNRLDPGQFFAPSGLPPTRIPEVGGMGGGYRPPISAPGENAN